MCLRVSTCTVAFVSFTGLFFFFDRFKFRKLLKPLHCISVNTDVDMTVMIFTHFYKSRDKLLIENKKCKFLCVIKLHLCWLL